MLTYLKDIIMVNTRRSSEIKGYKITDNERKRRFGIGANSLKMLKEKAKLKFPIKDLCIYLATDGLEVSDEDYFHSLPAQTLFIISPPNAIITTDADFELTQLRERTPLLKVADIFYDFIEQHPDKFRRMIINYEKSQLQKCALNVSKTSCSSRAEHAEWFAGEDRNCATKEQAMVRRAQDRMRGYFYKAKEELTRSALYRQNLAAKQLLDGVIEKFRYLLIACNYFDMLFDRKCSHRHVLVQQHMDDEADAGARVVPSKRLKQLIKEHSDKEKIFNEWMVSLCNELGDFYCQGAFSCSENELGKCSYAHNINPYESRENLILFQVWNLDHQIELTRTILPSLLENVRQLLEGPAKKCAKHKRVCVDISVLEYFLEIFSVKNLRLVHIVCHEKVQRQNKSQGGLVCENCQDYKVVQKLMATKKENESENTVNCK